MTQAVQSDAFSRALSAWDEKYDLAIELIKEPLHSPGYHTSLQGGEVHPTYQSLIYAVACLDAGDDERFRRAEGILRRVLSVQDTDPDHNTYGIWPWFYDEPLERMSPPDWNWADFCGKELLQVYIDHRERLDAELAADIAAAIHHACLSIIRRNVGPGYTNIALMGTYVTLVAGEQLHWPEIAEYGLARLRRFTEYTRERGGFTEYNSPTYTRVAIGEISRLRRHAQAPEARAMIEELHHLAWAHLARHFHAPTRQWAGPHSRCYNTLQGEEFASFLQWSSGGKLNYLPEDALQIEVEWPRLQYALPDDFLPDFAPLTAPRTTVEIYQPAAETYPPVRGTAYLHPDFCFSTASHINCWNQSRGVLAYWGTAESPSYLRLRLLHDGYDFSSGYLFAVQRDNALLAAATLVTDNGDTHPILDPIHDGRLTVSDLRLRVEIGGAAAADVTDGGWDTMQPLLLRLAGLPITLHAPLATCAGNASLARAYSRDTAGSVLHLPPGAQEPPTAAYDLVLYHGPETVIELAQLYPFVVVIGIALGEHIEQAPICTLEEANVAVEWALTPALALTAPVGPRTMGELLS